MRSPPDDLMESCGGASCVSYAGAMSSVSLAAGSSASAGGASPSAVERTVIRDISFSGVSESLCATQRSDEPYAGNEDQDQSPEERKLLERMREVMRSELKVLHAKIKAELKDVSAAVTGSGKNAAARRGGRTNTGGQSEVRSDVVSPHAWVSRNMRSYAAAAELTDMEVMSSSTSSRTTIATRMGPGAGVGAGVGRHDLLPSVIPKGSGPLAKAFRRSDSSASVGHQSRVVHAQPPRRLQKQGSAPVGAFDNPEASSHMMSSRGGGRANRGLLVQGVRSTPVAVRVDERAPSVNSSVSGSSSFTAVHPEVTGVSSKKSGWFSDPGSVPAMEEPPPLPTDTSPELLGRSMSRVRHLGYLPTIKSMSFANTFSWMRSSSGPLVEAKRSYSLRKGALWLVRHLYFENLTLCFILMNTATIGVQTDYSARNLVEEGPPEYQALDAFIAAFFGLELSLRLFAYRCNFFTMTGWRWNILDLSVVLLQVVEEIMVQSRISESNMPIALSLVRLLRILRLIRIIRVVRLLRYMAELRTIVVSITSSVKPLASTIVLLALVVYIVGVYFTQLTLTYRIDNHDPVAAAELNKYFGSVGDAVISLFQTVTGGLEWRDMVAPLMTHISPVMGLVFSLYVVFTSLALMNIVTGVFVETALQRGREDKDVYMINHLKDLFGVLDENQNGIICWRELEEHLDDPKLKAFFREIDIDVSEARGLFMLLDRDGSGTIDADEFLSGCLRLRGPAKALDLQLIMRELADQRGIFQRYLGGLDSPADALSDGDPPPTPIEEETSNDGATSDPP